MEAWVGAATPIQAWIADCAWIPEFSSYEEFRSTPYEALANAQWERDDRTEVSSRLDWLLSRLRFVAPTIWLGGDMARQLDMTVLATVADTAQFGDTLEIRLRDPSNLRGLEAVLAPLLLLREQPDLVR
jgi:glutathione S-transferase